MTDSSLSPSEQRWIATRRHLRVSRLELARKAAALYPGHLRAGATVLLTRPEWLPQQPIGLEEVELAWSATEPNPKVLIDTARAALPRNSFGVLHENYAETMLSIDRPRLLENRPCYRLTRGALMPGESSLHFGPGHYFDVLNVGEAAAHEFAAADLAGEALELSRLPLRAAVGDPTDADRRPMLAAITTLTIRYDKRSGQARFLVHWRDPAKVAMNGDYFQVTPVGMFQPAGAAADQVGDFDLWRCMAREYSEELLGSAEHEDVDYESWPFFQTLQQARNDGTCKAYLLGIGVDPLTFAADILAVAVFESELFDELFGAMVAENAEGYTDPRELPFTATEVRRMADVERTQPAGAAVLDIALRSLDVAS